MSSRETIPAINKDFVKNHASNVFGDPKKMYSWMNTPNAVFGGMRPKDFIEYASEENLQAVVDELDRIEQGLF